jgi:integrase
MKNSKKKRLRTIETYESVVRRHLIPAFDKIPLQQLSAGHIQHYYNTSELASSTLEQHHAILHQALKVATINERLLNVNPAEMVVEKPVAEKDFDMQVWDEEEVRRFLTAARDVGIEVEAFYTLAIETGMRKGELCGLTWDDVDINARRISVRRTLLKTGSEPVLGIPKSGRSRAITISPQPEEVLVEANNPSDPLTHYGFGIVKEYLRRHASNVLKSSVHAPKKRRHVHGDNKLYVTHSGPRQGESKNVQLSFVSVDAGFPAITPIHLSLFSRQRFDGLVLAEVLWTEQGYTAPHSPF